MAVYADLLLRDVAALSCVYEYSVVFLTEAAISAGNKYMRVITIRG